MRSRTITAITLASVIMGPLSADERPYSGLEIRAVKALSEQQVADYLGGKGMGLALAGELNGYPGPKHVLELAGILELSASQRLEVERIFEAMQSQAISLGERIVAAEAQLDTSFAEGSINPEQLKMTAPQIGLLQGELRAVHLLAHLETRAVLNTEQIQQYAELRGYKDSGHQGMQHNGHGH